MVNYEKFLADFYYCDVLIMNTMVFFDEVLRNNYLRMEQFDRVVLMNQNFIPNVLEKFLNQKFNQRVNKMIYNLVREKHLKVFQQYNQSKEAEICSKTPITVILNKNSLIYDTQTLIKISQRINANYDQFQSDSSPGPACLSLYEQVTSKLQGISLVDERVSYLMKEISKGRFMVKGKLKSMLEDQAQIEIKRFF